MKYMNIAIGLILIIAGIGVVTSKKTDSAKFLCEIQGKKWQTDYSKNPDGSMHMVCDDRSTLRFGNITGSGLPIEEVRANASMYPMSGLPESAEAREAFMKSL